MYEQSISSTVLVVKLGVQLNDWTMWCREKPLIYRNNETKKSLLRTKSVVHINKAPVFVIRATNTERLCIAEREQ
jgi:hypothetical protein